MSSETTTKKAKPASVRPVAGDERWFVEWCTKLAWYDNNPEGDVEHDRCEYEEDYFSTEAQAERYAKKMYRQFATKTTGQVRYWLARFTSYEDCPPSVGYWDQIGESKFID